MILRFWLRQNFWRRRLRWLGERAQRQLFGSFLLPSLLPRSPVLAPEIETATATEVPTDARAMLGGCELRVLSSERVALETTYIDWIAPLMRLPHNTTGAQFRIAMEGLPGYHPEGQHFFPVQAYVDSLSRIGGLDMQLAHRCRASRQPPAQLLTSGSSSPVSWFEPSVLLIYNSPGGRK